ncbi:microtubule-associated protein futsch [Diachasma alloeum]|uniref:microtubule-associated protein futsch n=1 Tax=Diachasma alloeum TaxID=454923 RepID=UPI0007383AB7|nr:microtubule-associated protein futsch [Diachasma alloeum]
MSTMDPPKSEGEPEKPAIPAAMVGTPTTGSQHPPPSPLSGCYLLVVLPEPHNAQHKDLILNRIAKGFLSWDKDNCHVDLEKELQALVAQAPEGEEARNGERLIQYATENLVTEILIHPQSNTLLQCIRNLLASFTKHRHIIHAGYTFSENGSWILQDGTFSLADFLDAFNEHDVQRVLRAYENSVTVDINCAAIGEWLMQRLSKEPCIRSCRVRLNPDDVLTAGVPAITSFTNYISQYLVPLALDQLMQPSDVVGNIRFSHPTLYVFPGGQGDAALFGINGFNMLVDGGFARKSCFWDFTRHLDRLDAVLLTRMNNSNVGGMSSVLRKKREMQVYPQIGHFFCNLVERKHSNSPDGDKDLDPLILSLTELGQEMMLNLKHINLRPHPCYRDPEPINLYHKVGHGTLDMYVLSPTKDSREVREFLSKWNAGDWKLFAGSHKKDSNNLTFPIQNLVSICALLVWQPANPEDTITRILFPGSTPQHKIFEGIERLRHLEFLKHPRCTAKSISPSASLVALKDKPMKIQKMSLMDRETKRAMEARKVKREEETKQKIELTQPEKAEEKPKPIPKKREIVENKKIEGDIKEDGVKDAKKIDKELKDVKETKKIVKDDVKKTEMIKTKPETEKTAAIKETKPKPERKEKKITKEPAQKISLPKTKPEATTEKKTKAPTPKKMVNGVSPKPEDKVKTAAITKSAPKAATKILPAAAPKSAKDANNRKVVEQKNIERMSMSKAPAKPKAQPAPPSEKKAVPRRPKPSGSPSKAKFIAGSPIKSAKSTPTASVKSDKDGVMRKIKTEKGTADSSTVSTPSAIEIDSMNKFTDKCLTEKSEDMSLDSIESKVLADLKEERQVVEEIEAVLQKAERIEVARKESRIEGEDEVTGDATDKKDITEDMTEDDVTADIDEVPRKSPIRKASQEQLTEEEDEYLIIEKEEGDTEDSVHSGETEHKHLLDAAQSEKEKILKDSEEYDEKEVVDEEELEPDELEEEEEDEVDEEEDEGEEKEMAVEKGIIEEREKSDDASEKKSHPEVEKTPDKDTTPLAEYKEQLEEEMKGIITSATEILQKTEEKEDSGKKDSEDITKEPSSLSPEKLDSSEKKTTDTDVKPEVEKTKEKMEESQERISTIESGATTTAPTLPEDERISVDAAKPPTTEKTIEDKKAEVPQKPKEIMPLTTEPSEVKPEVRMFNVRQGPQVLQRDIVKTPDEVADLPVHEEVDPKLYKMEDFEKSKDEKAQVPVSAPQELKESPSKEQKGVLGFFGKVADKFERGMDKLTGKGRRESEKDIDEKSSSKSGSPKEEVHHDVAPAAISEIHLPKTDEKEQEQEPEKPAEATIPTTAPPKSSQSEERNTEIPLDGLQKSTEALDDLEDADGVEALLEEASKKFKTVKDSLRDSLESLEEKIVEEEFKRAAQLAATTKDEVKDTLDEVVEKLEEIQPQMHGIEVNEKEPEKVHFVVPADDEEEEATDLVRDMKEAVREVGEVLAGTAGIVLDEKPKDVTEIVKKVAEVLKEDDFLFEKALFETSAKIPTQKDEIEEVIEKKASPLLECKEEPCIKKTVAEEPAIPDGKEQISDKTDAKAICEDLMKDIAPAHPPEHSTTEHEGIDVMEAGVEEVCQKIAVPEREQKHDSPEQDFKEERRDSVEIEPTQISLEHKIAPTTAEYVMVTPDSVPPSPKFPNEKLQSHIEKEMIVSNLPRPGLPTEVQSIIESAKNIDEIIEQLVFIRNEKITIEIIEYIILIKRVPREQIIHVIQEIIMKKKVPQESVVVDANILLLDEQTKKDIVELDEKEKSADAKGESPKDEDDSIVTDKNRSDVESEILNEYLAKNKKITQTIIDEIHVRQRVPIYVIIEIIEYIIIQKKLQKQSLVDINDATWEKLKSDAASEGEEEEGKSVDEDQQLEDFIIVPSAEEVENIHRAESDILDSYVAKGKKFTREIIEEIHVTRKIPIYVVIEIIEKIIITKKLSKNSVVDIPEAIWNGMKSEALKEEKLTSEKVHDGFEAVEQEYKFLEKEKKIETDQMEREEALEDDTSDVIEADEKLIDKSLRDKPQASVTEKTITEPEEKKFAEDRKLSVAEVQKGDASEPHLTKETTALQSEADEESSTVRRMIVTTTSEDGGDEIVICPTGSITFAKATTPEDSLKGSPIKTEPDKDSLHSHESTPEKDSVSTKDSLDKSPTSIRDSQTLDDSIEKSKAEEKKISKAPLPEKAIKDLHLDQLDKEPSDFDKIEDVSPAESVFAESPLKESSKSDVVDAKPISDEKTLQQVPKQEEKVSPSAEQEPTPIKDTMEKEKMEVVLDKSRSSSIGSLTQDEMTPAPIDTSIKDAPPSQELIVKTDGKDIAHETSVTPITAPSSDVADSTLRKKSVVDTEKEEIVPLVKTDAGEETETTATVVPSDKALELKIEDKTIERKSPSPGPEAGKSTASPDMATTKKEEEGVKESGSSRASSPISKESPVPKEEGKLDGPSDKLDEKESIKSPPSPVVSSRPIEKLGENKFIEAIEKAPSMGVAELKTEKVTSPLRKASITSEKDDEDKKSSTLDTLDDQKLVEKDKIDGIADSKSPTSPKDISPMKEGGSTAGKDSLDATVETTTQVSVILDKSSAPSEEHVSPDSKEPDTVKDDIKHEEIGTDAQEKSPTPSPTKIMSSKSSRETSPIRKQSLLIGSADTKTDIATDDRKSPVSSVGDARSTKSSREVSPVRKESLVVEGDVKTEVDDKKSPAPSIADGRSPLSSRDVSPLRKESSAVEKLDEKVEKTGTLSPTVTSPSPVRKESISHDKEEKTLEAATKPDEKVAPSPVGSISPIQKASLTVDEKVLPSAVPTEHEEKIIDSEHSPKSAGGVSPIRKKSIGKLEDARVETGIDRASPSPAESVKSPVSPRDTSPMSKESIAVEEKESASPRLSMDITSEEKIGDGKSPSPLAASIKSSTSPGDTSPIRKQSLVSDKKLPTSDLEEESVDLKSGEVGIEKKSQSPVTESRKSSVTPHDSSIEKESLVLEDKISTPRASVDLKSEDVALDKKSPSPVIESSISPRETSPARKESIAMSEKGTASPRPSIDITSEGNLLDKKSPSPKLASPRDTSPAKDTHSLIEETILSTPTTIIDSKTDEHREKASSPEDKVSISSTPRASMDIKHEEATTDKKTPSPDEKISISDTPKAFIDIKHQEGTADKETPVPGEKEEIVGDKKTLSPDVKVSVSDTPKSSIDIKMEEGTADKKTSGPGEKEESADDTETPSPDAKVSVSDTPKASIDIKREEGTADKKTSSPGEKEKSADDKETSSPDVKVSVSDTARASIDIKMEEETADKKTSSPDEKEESVDDKETSSPDVKVSISDTPRASIDNKMEEGTAAKKIPTPGEKEESAGDKEIPSSDVKVSVSETPKASIDIKMEEGTADKKTSSPGEKEKSADEKETPSPDVKVSVSDTPRASIDIKMEEGTADTITRSPDEKEESAGDKKIPSPDVKVSVTDTPKAFIDIKMEEGTADTITRSPDEKEESAGDKKIPSPDVKVSVTDTPKAFIDIKMEEGTADTKTPSPDEKVEVSDAPRVSIDLKQEKEAADKKSPSPDEKVPISGTSRAPIDMKLGEETIDKKSLSPDEKVPISDTPRTSIDIKHEEETGDKKTPSPDEKASISDTPRASIDIKQEQGTLEKKTPSPDEKVSVSGTPRASIDIKHEEETADKKTPSPDEKVSISDTPEASIDIKHEEGTPQKTSSPDEKISISGTPRASIDIKLGEEAIDKKSSSPDEEVLVSGTPRASIDTKHDETADKKASSPDDKISISGSPKKSIDIKHEEEIADKRTPIADEKVSINGTLTASIEIKHEVETTDKKKPSPDEKVSLTDTPRASIDVKSIEETSLSGGSPIALSPVRKRSISEQFDGKDGKHIDEKSSVSAATTKESIILEDKQVIETSISAKLPGDATDVKIHDQKSPSPGDVALKSATSSRGVSPVRKESLAEVPQHPEETGKDLKSSASSRDVSPVRKESLIPKADGKSTESSAIISPARRESPTPDATDTSAVTSTLSLKITEKLEDDKVSEKSSGSSQATCSARKASLEGKSVESSGLILQKPEDIKVDTKSPSPPKSPAPSDPSSQRKDDGSLAKDPIEKGLGMRSRSSSMASEKSTIEPTKDEKVIAKDTLHQVESSIHANKSEVPLPTESSLQKPTPAADKPQDAEFPEAPSRDRSRSHSLFDTGEKTPLGRSRAASLFEDKDDIVKSVSRKSSGLSEFHEDHFQREEAEDDFEVSEAKRIDIERYIMSQYVTRKRKITGATLEEIVALYDVPNYIVIETIYEICDKMKIPRESIIDDVSVIDETQMEVSKGLSEPDKLSQIPHTTRINIEDYVTQEYIIKKKRISQKTLHEISMSKGVDENTLFIIIESIMIERKIPRESLLDEDALAAHSSRKSPAIKEEHDDEHHPFEKYKESVGTGGGITQYKEEGMSGKSSPERRSSGYSTPEVRHYDDKYESQFHKAFVGGMTEIRTTHITTLSGKSTPDVGARTETPDSLPDTASSDKMDKDHSEGEPVIIKRTVVTEVPEYETTIKKTIVKREIIEEDDDGASDGQPSIISGFDDKGAMKVDLSRSLMSSSSGRSTPDKIRDLSEGRSSTDTPDSLRSHEVIKTTITKTRTMSDEGEIITTTKEVTETTNERGETVVVEEKVDVKTTQAEPGMEISGHHWPEQRHHEDSEEDSPLSATSQVYHYEKGDQKHVEFSTADMSSSFYGKLPDVPQPRHPTEPVGDDKDFSFKKFSLEKQSVEGGAEHMTTSRQFADVADYDVDKVLREHEKEHEGDDKHDKGDPIGGWGTPLKLPSPERPDKFNLRSTPIVRSSVDMSPDSLNFDVINDWGEPLRLPSPAPTADEASNKTMPPTPKKERRQPKKIVAENMKNKKRSDSPASKEKKKDSKKVQPVYLDLTYVPHHGNSYYASLEFFKRVRARYYVFSGTEPSREVYDALLDAKKTWENKNLEVTMIPTYDTDTLGYWVADNEEALAANHIDLSPSASRCTINLQDHETSCSAYRLEF